MGIYCPYCCPPQLSVCNVYDGPFDIRIETDTPDVKHTKIPSEVTTVAAVDAYLDKYLSSCEKSAILVATSPYVKFPQVHGFLYYKYVAGVPHPVCKTAWLSKTDDQGPVSTEVPACLSQIFVVSARRAGEGSSDGKWKHLSMADVEVLLGYSMNKSVISCYSDMKK